MDKRNKVAIIDYQLGNMFSVKQACEFLGYEAIITSSKDELRKADYAILPGVGAFGDAMDNLEKLDLVSPVHDFIASGKPFMGVCLGLQLLFSESEEFGNNKGLSIVNGTVKRFPFSGTDGQVLKVPQIEWNEIYEKKEGSWQKSPLSTCRDGDHMYFVHSFFVEPADESLVLSETVYGGLRYCSSILMNNVFACQFHPEKSGRYGVEIYNTWFKNNAQ